MSVSGPPSARARLAALVMIASGCVALAGCAATAASDHTSTPRATATASVSATPTPTSTSPPVPVLVPNGPAQENLPLFRAVTLKVWAGPDQVHGRAYIDALVAAGFDKAAMQVTQDESTVGNPAESIQFSVHWKDGQCLIGQVGPQTGAPVTVVVPGLPGGLCLLGQTRPIDW